MPQSQGTRFTADPLTFIVRHQLWDANVEDHSDQGVSIDVAADIDGKQTSLLRFNCFDIERSYVYGPENPGLTTPGRVGGGMGVHCRMDPIIDGNPIGWTMRILGQKLPKMLDRAGYKDIAQATDLAAVQRILPDVEACSRETFATKRNTVKHNRGTDIFEAGNIRFGLEMRRQRERRRRPGGPRTRRRGRIEREGLCRRDGTSGVRLFLERRALPLRAAQQEPSYQLGYDNHRRSAGMDLRADREQKARSDDRARRLPGNCGRPGPGQNRLGPSSVEETAFEMYEEGERLTGHKGLPLEFTPNLAAE